MVTFGTLRQMAQRLSADELEKLVGPFVFFRRSPRPPPGTSNQFQRTVTVVRRVPGALAAELVDGDVGNLGRLRENGEYEIGRLVECDLIVADASVSKHHARIAVAGGECRLFDLGSRNGTFVEEVRVEAAGAALKDEQRVRFGDSEFLFVRTRALYRAL